MNRRRSHWPLFLALAMLLLAMLACGGFQVRVTPTPKPSATATESKPAATVPPAKTTASASKAEATATPTATTAPSPTAAPVGLAPGAKARVAASGGINIRDKASAKGKRVGRLNANAVVTLLEGPTQADNYAWWKIDNGAGAGGLGRARPGQRPLVGAGRPAAAGHRSHQRAEAGGSSRSSWAIGCRLPPARVKWLTVRETAGRQRPRKPR